MGRGERKRTAKKRKSQNDRRIIRAKMGKKIFFNLTHCCKKLRGISNRYNYKSNMHGLIYKDAHFVNVRYQSSIITDCNFNNCKLTGVDFCNSNLKSSTFKNAILNDICFINCNLKNVDFSNAKLNNVTFICTNIDVVKDISFNAIYKVYTSYPKICVDPQYADNLLRLSENDDIYEPHVIHVKKDKLNYWTLNLLYELYGNEVFRALNAIGMRKNKSLFYTIYAYKRHIESYLKL